MLRDPLIESPDGFGTQTFVMESAKEQQQTAKFMPDSRELPTTHEHFVTHHAELRNGQTLSLVTVGVRRKVSAPPSEGPDQAYTASPPLTAEQRQIQKDATSSEPDNLNDLDDAAIELEAAKIGIVVDAAWRKKGKPARVKAIRDKRSEKPVSGVPSGISQPA